ncbi:MAG: hypothetical protein ABSG45_03520 [Nitrososphaerales archaeon]
MHPVETEMVVSRTRRIVVIAAVVLALASATILEVWSLQRTPVSTTQQTSPAETVSGAKEGSISFTSPLDGAVVTPGQSLTISGVVTPTPQGSDSVVIEAGQSDSTAAILPLVIPLQPDGTFSYSTTVSHYWYPGAYLIVVSDATGATGSEYFIVGTQS